MLENLMGKIVYWCNGNYNRTGAVKAIAGDALLIQFDCMTGEKTDWSWPMELVCMEEITHANWSERDDDGNETFHRIWGFFDSREALEKYKAYLDQPSPHHKPVVQLATHRKK